MRWLIDEGMPKPLVTWLAERGDDVLSVSASRLRGSADEALWQVACDQQRIIITRDLGFIPAQPSALPPGMVLVRAPDRSRSPAILRLVQDGLAAVPDLSLEGKLTVIRPGRVRQRPLAAVIRAQRRL